MVLVAAVGGAAFLLLCIVGGARLLMLARRTRELPELALGSALFLMGGVATPIGALARVPTGLPVAVNVAFLVAQGLILTLGMTGLAIFTRRVFRPERPWAGAICIAVPASMLASMVVIHFDPGYVAALTTVGLGDICLNLSLLLPLGWAGTESLLYARALKRRIPLGLADPVVFDRVRLWGVAMTLAALLSAFVLAGSLRGVNVLATVAGAGFIGCMGLIAGGALYLAFLPPAFYTRWVTARLVPGA